MWSKPFAYYKSIGLYRAIGYLLVVIVKWCNFTTDRFSVLLIAPDTA